MDSLESLSYRAGCESYRGGSCFDLTDQLVICCWLAVFYRVLFLVAVGADCCFLGVFDDLVEE